MPRQGGDGRVRAHDLAFQPGQTTIEEVEDLIGPTTELNAIHIGDAEPDGIVARKWAATGGPVLQVHE